MRRSPERLGDREFDLLIVGGGISGACLAHDAALRGLSVALVEKSDFGAATSAASSKLLHGGIRYLQQLQIGKVRESARERAAFLRIAPHLIRWVPFIVPTFSDLLRGRAVLSAGMTVYGLLCRGQDDAIRDPSRRVPRSRFLTRSTLLDQLPSLAGLKGLTGAHALYEAHMHSSERMTLAFVKSAAASGAEVANHVRVEALLRDGARVRGARVRDLVSGNQIDVRARVVANAAGPWLARLNEELHLDRLRRDITSFSKGVHIVTRELISGAAIAFPTRRRGKTLVDRGGRHMFVIPWRDHSLIGTTDSPFAGGLDDVAPAERDVEELIGEVRAALPNAGLTAGDVRFAYAGLYPLTEKNVRPDVYQGTGDYQLVDHAATAGIDGFVSVLGAKYTTARRLAERAADLVVRKLGARAAPCRTRSAPLAGGDIEDLSAFTTAMHTRYAGMVAPDIVAELVANYGTEMDEVLGVARAMPDGLTRLAAARSTIEAEVLYAVDREMAVHLDDVVFRRTGLGTIGHPGEGALRRCAALMGERLGWTASQIEDEIARVEARYRLPAG
jgi:glycerol-3-phosphate dehydrogenase